MIPLEKPFRVANEADAFCLAELVNFAGEGLPFHVWQALANNDQDPWEIGRTRQAEKANDGQIVVVDFGDGAVAELTGYIIGDSPKYIGDDFPEMFRPLQELENQALNSWYVNVLACYPEQRGRGLGTRLLKMADRIARDANLHKMSVIVASENSGARKLYERQGYSEIAKRPCFRGPWQTDSDDWVLLMKTLE